MAWFDLIFVVGWLFVSVYFCGKCNFLPTANKDFASEFPIKLSGEVND